jgi:hypothetical protein
MTPTQLRVPHVIAWSGEVVQPDLCFEWADEAGGLRLAHRDPHPDDRPYGVLRARVGLERGGEPQWRLLNTIRQWECMEQLLCQVCGEPAQDGDRIPWVITETGYRATGDDSGLTNAPPTCRTCIPDALAEPTAVLADLYWPRDEDAVWLGWRNEQILLEEFVRLQWALATQLVVELVDMRPEPSTHG